MKIVRAFGLVVVIVGCILFETNAAADSVCYGSASKGRLEEGVRIPERGPNYAAYSQLGYELGRTYVHSKVALTLEAAYAELSTLEPDKQYLYGESGWRSGGRIRPHRTHQNGLAVDFMVPVVDGQGRSVQLPTSILNKFGYGIEFDGRARYEGFMIDFDAIAAHLLALDRASKKYGIGIGRVIFEKAYLPRLYAARQGELVKKSIPFMQGEPWIRHDEHYHVDFKASCQPLNG